MQVWQGQYQTSLPPERLLLWGPNDVLLVLLLLLLCRSVQVLSNDSGNKRATQICMKKKGGKLFVCDS